MYLFQPLPSTINGVEHGGPSAKRAHVVKKNRAQCRMLREGGQAHGPRESAGLRDRHPLSGRSSTLFRASAVEVFVLRGHTRHPLPAARGCDQRNSIKNACREVWHICAHAIFRARCQKGSHFDVPGRMRRALHDEILFAAATVRADGRAAIFGIARRCPRQRIVTSVTEIPYLSTAGRRTFLVALDGRTLRKDETLRVRSVARIVCGKSRRPGKRDYATHLFQKTLRGFRGPSLARIDYRRAQVLLPAGGKIDEAT